MPAITTADLFGDAFNPIARAGAGTRGIGIRRRKAFGLLARVGPEAFRATDRRRSLLATMPALSLLRLDEERARIRALSAAVPDDWRSPAPVAAVLSSF